MDYFSERFKQNVLMEKYSTEIISKSYSDPSHKNDPGIYDNREIFYMAEDGSEAEICSVESGNSKKATSTTAQLSAQIMNLPYNKFNEFFSNEAPRSPENSIYYEYDIFKKIREAYAACACKICKCLTGITITPGIEFCDCEPCKCKDCTLNNNLRFNNANLQSGLDNKTCNRTYQMKSEVKGTRCNCKPCNCVECSLHCSPLRSDYHVENKIKEVARKMTKISPLGQNSPQDGDAIQYTSININKLTNCKRVNGLNGAYEAEKTKHARGEALSKQMERSANDFKNYITTLNNEHPVTIYQSRSNKKCACSVCECIVCECNGNGLTSLNATPYENIKVRNVGLANSKFCECATCKYQLYSHKKQPTSQSIIYSECKCDICSCIQCERDFEWKKNCFQGYCEITEGGCKTSEYSRYPLKKQLSISRMMRENPLTNECNEYTKLMKSRTQSSLTFPEKTKYGNIYYVSNDKTYQYNFDTNKILRQTQSTMTENKIDKAVNKDSDRKMDNKRQRKLTQVENTMKTATRRTNSRICKRSVKDVAVSILPNSLGKGAPLTNVGKKCLHSFYPACRSTQTVSKSSSSLLPYQNNGCCTHTISLPDTNIVDDFTSTTSESDLYEIRKNNYQIKHDIYLCCKMKKGFNKTNATKLVSVQQNDNENRKNVVETFLFDTFDKYLTKSCNMERPKQDKRDPESVHTIIRKAKKFTLYLNKILNKYEKANSEFESVSEKLKKSYYIMLNKANDNYNCQVCGSINSSQVVRDEQKIDTKPNKSFLLKHNRSCNLISKHAGAIEVQVNTIESCKINETVVAHLEIVKNSRILNQNIEKQSIKISQSSTNALHCNTNQTEKHNEAKVIVQKIDGSRGSVNALRDEKINRMPSIKNVIVNNPHEHAFSEAELQRTKKILNILKQNMTPDIFTERVSSPRSMPEMERKDNLVFNYHTKTLMKSTVPSILL